MTQAGIIALQLQDQGWRGLLPLLPHDATPNVRLALDKAAELANGRGKAPGRWARAGWSLLPDWRVHPDDAETVGGWSSWPGVNVGLRACYMAPWVAFIDVDVLHQEAAAETQSMLRRYLASNGEFLPRIGNAPKFLIPVRSTEPVRRARSTVIQADGQKHMVELLGQGQQAVIAGIHPKTGRSYVWPEGGLEETEPHRLPLVTPGELTGLLDACSKILLRYGPAAGRQGRPVRAEFGTEPKRLAELRARDPGLARAAAGFVVNTDWSRDDWVAWAYALRGAFGDDGRDLWLRFAAQSAKATNPATAVKVWQDATQAERAGQLRAGAGTIIRIAIDEGFRPPPLPGLPAYFDGGEQDPGSASAALRLAVIQWVEQGLAYSGKGEAPRDAIAGGVGLGKSTVTLQVLADMAQDKTVHYYAPTLELAAEVVGKAKSIGLPAVMIRGREANRKDPDRWPALCRKDDVAATLGRVGRNVWESLCRKVDEFSNVTQCEFFDGCPYVRQFDGLEGKLVVLAHEWLTLPKLLIAKPSLAVLDERFHTSLLRTASLPLERVGAQRPSTPGVDDIIVADLTHDARVALGALEAGKTMAEAGLDPDRLRLMARYEERLADPPAIWPDLPYAEQQTRARRLQEIEAFRLAKLWRVLAHDNDKISQRVVIARGIEWHGELQDRVFIHTATAPVISKALPVLVLDADHDALIGAATVPTNRRTVIRARLNAEVIQVCNTTGSKNKLMGSAARREQVLALARHEAAQDRQVLIGTYKPVAELLRSAFADAPDANIHIAHFGAIRGLDCWKDFDTVIVVGREQPPPLAVENMARSLFGANSEPLLLAGEYVPQMRGHRTKDGSRTAVVVQVHPDPRVQALVEQAREREIEQMVGRLRLVHRNHPARVLLLTNLPTALPVDRFTTWEGIMPDKMEQAIMRGRGVLPLSHAELARVHPDLWATAKEAEHWLARKGPQVPIRELYWKVGTLSVATLVSYRRPGQRRGSPQQAMLPGRFDGTLIAEALLAGVVGEVEQVRILNAVARPGIVEETPGVLPEPLVIPGLRTIGAAAGDNGLRGDFVIRIVPPWPGLPPLGAAA